MYGVKRWVAAAGAAMLLSSGAAFSQSVTLFQAGGINAGSFSAAIDPIGRTVNIQETWTSSTPGFLLFSGFSSQQGLWSVTKTVTNSTGSSWTRFANELLDPLGPGNDDGPDPLPYPAFVPVGWSTSNDSDGVSFATPRNSNVFASVFVDELTDARDFIDYFNGIVASGGSANLNFNLQGLFNGEDFLLLQRPNEFSTVVPVPAALPLLASGLLAFGWLARRRKA